MCLKTISTAYDSSLQIDFHTNSTPKSYLVFSLSSNESLVVITQYINNEDDLTLGL